MKVELIRLTRRFGAKYVFRDVSCTFDAGIHAIVGPNGIGKTTLLTTLAGIESPESGDVVIGGASLLKQPLAARQMLFYAPDKPVFYEHMTGKNLIATALGFRGMSTDAEAFARYVELFDLEALYGVKMASMSLGMQRRIFFSLAFAGNGLIVLDEPTNGMDKHYRQIIIEEIARKRDSVILFSSHDGEFIDSLNASIWALDASGLRSQAVVALA